jgi:hypothetical protein
LKLWFDCGWRPHLSRVSVLLAMRFVLALLQPLVLAFSQGRGRAKYPATRVRGPDLVKPNDLVCFGSKCVSWADAFARGTRADWVASLPPMETDINATCRMQGYYKLFNNLVCSRDRRGRSWPAEMFRSARATSRLRRWHRSKRVRSPPGAQPRLCALRAPCVASPQAAPVCVAPACAELHH